MSLKEEIVSLSGKKIDILKEVVLEDTTYFGYDRTLTFYSILGENILDAVKEKLSSLGATFRENGIGGIISNPTVQYLALSRGIPFAISAIKSLFRKKISVADTRELEQGLEKELDLEKEIEYEPEPGSV